MINGINTNTNTNTNVDTNTKQRGGGDGCSERVSLGCKLERGSCTRCTSHQPEALFINTYTHKYKYKHSQIHKCKSKQILKKLLKVHQPSARGAFHNYKYSQILMHKYTIREIFSCLKIAAIWHRGFGKTLNQMSLVLFCGKHAFDLPSPMLRIVTVSNFASSLPLCGGGLA